MREGVIAKMNREQLEISRTRRHFLEEMIEMYEKMLTDPELIWSPASVEQVRHELAKWRETVKFMQVVQGELEKWEKEKQRNPGRETDSNAIKRLEKAAKEHSDWLEAFRVGRISPMPREVKR